MEKNFRREKVGVGQGKWISAEGKVNGYLIFKKRKFSNTQNEKRL